MWQGCITPPAADDVQHVVAVDPCRQAAVVHSKQYGWVELFFPFHLAQFSTGLTAVTCTHRCSGFSQALGPGVLILMFGGGQRLFCCDLSIPYLLLFGLVLFYFKLSCGFTTAFCVLCSDSDQCGHDSTWGREMCLRCVIPR